MAYHNFMGNVGFTAASLQIKNLISDIKDNLHVTIEGVSVKIQKKYL